MSTSTKRYGRILFTATIKTEADVQPSKRLLRQRDKLDRDAFKATACKEGCCGRTYAQLTDKEKVDLHYSINVAKEQARRAQGAKDLAVDARHDQDAA